MKCYIYGQSYKTNPYKGKSYVLNSKLFPIISSNPYKGLLKQGNIWKFLKELIFHLPWTWTYRKVSLQMSNRASITQNSLSPNTRDVHVARKMKNQYKINTKSDTRKYNLLVEFVLQFLHYMVMRSASIYWTQLFWAWWKTVPLMRR